jgi:hypothetical protein
LRWSSASSSESNADGGRECGDIDYAKRSVFLTNPDFPHAGADAGHRLPVIRIIALLHLKQLKACFSPRRRRKAGQILQSAATKFDGPCKSIHGASIQNFA